MDQTGDELSDDADSGASLLDDLMQRSMAAFPPDASLADLIPDSGADPPPGEPYPPFVSRWVAGVSADQVPAAMNRFEALWTAEGWQPYGESSNVTRAFHDDADYAVVLSAGDNYDWISLTASAPFDHH